MNKSIWIGTATAIAVAGAFVVRRRRSTVSPPSSFRDHLGDSPPSYKVHVYHDTGEKVTIGGRRRVLNPQSSFGYLLNHAGALTGWKHALSSQRITAERVGSDVEPPTPDPSDAPLGAAVARGPKRPKHDP